ncbi:hypothetical protein ACSX1A_20385 [Pontibacter sp. MBLB2868]|uniref:hypothetical protein n=1 Tax=Pontibacter sp. MBLB2868 TaxID=3451555 RepID=UPI003F756E02
MRFLLTLKNWQAFLLLFALPFLLQYGLKELTKALHYNPGDLAITVLDALPTAFLTLWFWSIGFYMFRRLPGSISISAVYFHMAALYFILYAMLMVFTLRVVRESITDGILPFGMLAMLIPMHLFATFCFLYMVYFVARCIVTVEEQRVVNFGEYTLVLIQLLVLPIGIWFLQPRLRNFCNPRSFQTH